MSTTLGFGAVLELDPPARRTIDHAVLAEASGFSHVWLYDTHVRWLEPYVIMSQVLRETERVVVGPFVTNPATRDPTVTASTLATLNTMFGDRTVCGIGRGDSAVRTQNGRPTTIAALREAVRVIGELGSGRSTEVGGSEISLPWASGGRLPVWVAGYGPRALRLAGRHADGVILQLADPAVLAWMIERVRAAAASAGRDPADIAVCVGAPAYVGDDLERAYEQNRWFAGLVGNHVADLVARYGTGGQVPRELTDDLERRSAYRYDKNGSDVRSYASDELVERFCVLGDTEAHIAKLRELRALGMTHFAAYLQHDRIEETMHGYGTSVIPALHAP